MNLALFPIMPVWIEIPGGKARHIVASYVNHDIGYLRDFGWRFPRVVAWQHEDGDNTVLEYRAS